MPTPPPLTSSSSSSSGSFTKPPPLRRATSSVACPYCTYHNSSHAQNCEMCGNDMWIENEKERPPREEQSEESKTPSSSSSFSSSSSSSSSTKNILPKRQQLTRGDLLLPFVEQALIAATSSSSSSSSSTSVSLLSSLYDYVLHRTPQLHRVCVVCDHPHMTFLNDCGSGGSGGSGGTAGGGMLRPSVCRRELCSWSFTELGVGRASTDELASTAEVVDLLLALTTAAATHPTRAKLILTPFPMIVDATGQRKKILNPKKPNYELAAEIAKQLPSMQRKKFFSLLCLIVFLLLIDL